MPRWGGDSWLNAHVDASHLGLNHVSNRWNPTIEVPYEWDAACAACRALVVDGEYNETGQLVQGTLPDACRHWEHEEPSGG